MLNIFSSLSIIKIICTIGFTIQLTDVIYRFLKFEVRYEINYKYPYEIDLPSIDFVFPLSSVINVSSLYLHHPNETSQFCRRLLNQPELQIRSFNQFRKHCTHLEPSSLFNSHLLEMFNITGIQRNIKDMRGDILTLTCQGQDLMASGYCKVDHNLTGYAYIMRVSCRNGSTPIVERITKNLIGNSPILCLTHKMNQFVGLRVSMPFSYIETRFSRYETIQPQSRSFYFVNLQFNRIIIERLPWPYESQCLHYDRTAKLLNCFNSKLARHRYVHTDSVLSFDDRYQVEYRFIHYDDIRKRFKQIVDQCFIAIESLECKFIGYHTTHKVYNYNQSAEVTTICLDPPVIPDLYIRAEAQSSITELLVYISSILGVWFGFSFYGELKSKDWGSIKNCLNNQVNNINDDDTDIPQ